jgi:DNA-binding response OmpR family regulator
MNNPLSDGNESVIDIFVLGRNETGTLQLIEQLEHQDYQVTLFTDEVQLFETLRSGNPNLIICDTTSFGQEAYDSCRQIKSDDNYWMIPVIILTRASTLGDLLYVLDSNADNFIAKPYDSSYLLSLIEEMLLTPVERQTPEQIKTQFKIQHDDRVFVVTADRRKLLEFLLSAFEIAVKNSGDLSSANNELQALSLRLKTLESADIENTRLIGTLESSVKKNEQEVHNLKGDLERTAQALDKKTAEVEQLSRDLGEVRTLLATAKEQIRILSEDKEKTAASHQSETSFLTDQVSSLTQEIRAKTTEIEAKKQTLEEETARSARLDLAVKESNVQIEQLKTSLQTLSLEHEKLALTLSSEKQRAHAAEKEIQSVLQAKAQSEQALKQVVDEQNDAARKQKDEILRLNAELEAVTGQCTSAELQQETLRHELEQLKAIQEVTEESHKRQLEDLQTRNDKAVATIFEQERELKILKDDLVVAHADCEKSVASAASLTAAFNDTRVEIEEREWKIQSLEKQIADAGILNKTSNEKIQALTDSLESLQSALNTEKEQHAATEKRLNAAISERDETLQSVHGAHSQTKTDLETHKKDLSKLNSDLDAAALLRSTLQGDLAAASSRIKELEFELKSAVQVKDQTDLQARSLAEELGATKAELETERRNSRTVEANLQKSVQDCSRLEGDIARLTGEQEQLKTVFEHEKMLHASAVEEVSNLTHAKDHIEHELKTIKEKLEQDNDLRTAKIQDSNKDFEHVLSRQRDLEQEVKTLESEKAAAEARADALSDEIQQARTALADEWEDHMNDEERLAATEINAIQREQSQSDSEKVTSELEHKWAVVVRQTDLPSEIKPTPKAVVITTPPVTHDEIVPPGTSDKDQTEHLSLEIEDLFEDETPHSGSSDQNSDPEHPDGASEEDTQATITDEDHDEEFETVDERVAEQETDEKEDADNQIKTSGDFITSPSSYGISFNRQQWFDLLKWSHHSGALSQEQRMQIVRMGRLIQKGRRLTKKQDEQVREMIVLVQTLGYQFH